MHIEMVIDHTAAKREIIGMEKLADESAAAGLLSPARLALMSDPSKITHTVSDLTQKRPQMRKAWEKH